MLRRKMIMWKDMRATDVAKKYKFKYLTKNAENKYIVRNMWSSDRLVWAWYSVRDTYLVSNKSVEAGKFHLILKDGTLIWGVEVYPPETGMAEKFKSAYANYFAYMDYACEWDMYTFEEEGYNEFKVITDRYKEEHPGVVYNLNI